MKEEKEKEEKEEKEKKERRRRSSRRTRRRRRRKELIPENIVAAVLGCTRQCSPQSRRTCTSTCISV